MISKTTILLSAALVFSLAGWALAQDQAKLLSMRRHSDLNSTSIWFEFNRTPEFETQSSGQKVEATFSNAGAGQELEPLGPDGDIVDSLVAEEKGDLVVSLVLRRPPERVESMTQGQSEVGLRVIWPHADQKSRPALSRDPGGFFQTAKDSALAGRFLSSKYSGSWERLFAEYETEIDLDPGLRFSRIPFPLTGSMQEEKLPEDVRQAASGRDWDQALEALRAEAPDLRQKHPGLEAELLWRSGRIREAHEAVNSIFSSAENPEQISARMHLLRAYVLLAQHRPYLAYCHLFSDQIPRDMDQQLARYLRLARTETALTTGRPEQALDLIAELHAPEDSAQSPGSGQDEKSNLPEVFTLRRIQALLALGQKDRAWDLIRKTDISMSTMLTAPQAMADLAAVYYERENSTRARPLYTQLSEVISPEEGRATALWRSGMCLRKSGHLDLARRILQEVVDEYPETAGGFRAQVSLTDMAMLKSFPEVKMDQVAAYQSVSEKAPNRLIREEAELKQIVALYQRGDLEQAVQGLSRFATDFAAGPSKNIAQALIAELVPVQVPRLLDQDQMVKGIALVAEHRDVLVRTDLPQDFLLAMGDAFVELGLYRRASRVFLYMLARAEREAEQGKVYSRLLHLWSRQGNMEDTIQYARIYREKFPRGRYSSKILALAAQTLIDNAHPDQALKLLADPTRPLGRDLDILTAKALYEAGELERMDRYLQRADMPFEPLPSGIRFDWGQAKSQLGQKRSALEVMQALGGGESGYALPALYQAAELSADLGQREEAIKNYQELAEKEDDALWAELAEHSTFMLENSDLDFD